MVACKPGGIAVHDGDDSLLKQLRPLVGDKIKLMPVHRLDRETSGVILLATNAEAAAVLQESMQAKDECVKRYRGIVNGELKQWGRWTKKLTAKAEGRRNPQGKSAERVEASTSFNVVGANQFLSVADFKLQTGRTHQIRKHAAMAGHHVIGDTRYGPVVHARKINERYGFDGMALHAAELSVRLDGKMRTFTAPLPASWASMLAPLELADGDETPSLGAEVQDEEEEDRKVMAATGINVERAMAGFAARKAAVLEEAADIS